MRRARVRWGGFDLGTMKDRWLIAGDTPRERALEAARWVAEWQMYGNGVALMTRMGVLEAALRELDEEEQD